MKRASDPTWLDFFCIYWLLAWERESARVHTLFVNWIFWRKIQFIAELRLEHWWSKILGWPEVIWHTPPHNLPKNMHYVILIQEAHGSWLAQLSEIATADVIYATFFQSCHCNQWKAQHLSSSWFWTRRAFIIIIFAIYRYGSQWCMTVWTSSQSRFNSRIDMKFDENLPSGLCREVQQYHDFIHVYSTGARKITLRE